MNKTFLKKEYLSLLLLCSLPACIPFKKKKHESTKPHKMETAFFDDVVDIPLQDANTDLETSLALNQSDFDDQENTRSFIFDEDEFVPKYDQDQDELVLHDNLMSEEQNLTWEQDQQIAEFKNIYFEFNNFNLNNDQEQILSYNIELAKQKLKENNDSHILLVIEGHSCHSSGSHAYNLALSEKRAQVLAQRFEQAGIPRDSIKIVGRGQEIPALVDGKPVTGTKEEQWLNRRDEIKIISA